MKYKGSDILCTHAQLAGRKSKCCRAKYDAQNLVSTVSYELRRQIKLLELLELKIQEHHQKDKGITDLPTLKKQVQTEIDILNAEKI